MFSGIIEVNFPVIKGSNDFFIPKYFLRCAYIHASSLGGSEYPPNRLAQFRHQEFINA